MIHVGDYILVNGRKVLVTEVFKDYVIVRYRCGTKKIVRVFRVG